MPDIKTGTIKIEGLSDLEERLKAFPDRVANNILSGAIRAGAVIIQNEARKLAPVAEKRHIQWKNGKKKAVIIPGNMRKNIKVRRAPRKSRTQPVEYWCYVGRKAYYWIFNEFGTKKMTAQPFMRPAFEAKKKEALERIREYLSKRIEKEAAKG